MLVTIMKISFHRPSRLYYSASYCHLAYPPLPSVYPPSQKLLLISSHPDIPSTTSSFAYQTSLSFTPSSHPTANLPTPQFMVPTLLISNFTFRPDIPSTTFLFLHILLFTCLPLPLTNFSSHPVFPQLIPLSAIKPPSR